MKIFRLSFCTLAIYLLFTGIVFAIENNPDSMTYDPKLVQMAEIIKQNGKEYQIDKKGIIKTQNGEITPPQRLSFGDISIQAAYDRYFRVKSSGSTFTGVAGRITFPTGIVVGTDTSGKTDVLYLYEGFNDAIEAGFYYKIINQQGYWFPFIAYWVGPQSNPSNYKWWESSSYSGSYADIKLKIVGQSGDLQTVAFYINGVKVKQVNIYSPSTVQVKRLNTVVGYTQLATYDNAKWTNWYVFNNNNWYLWTTSYPLVSENDTNGSFSNTWVNKYYNNTVNLR